MDLGILNQNGGMKFYTSNIIAYRTILAQKVIHMSL